MSWPVVAAGLVVAYLAGRFIERAWLSWSAAVLAIIAPVSVWVAMSGLLTAEDDEGWVVAILMLVSLDSAGKLGIALLGCLVGRSQRLQA